MPLLLDQSSDLIQAESDFVTAKAQYRIAQTSAARQRDLYKVDGTALKDWQRAQADLVTASAALASARNRLRLLGKSDAEIAALERHGLPTGAVFSVGTQSTLWLVANVREEDSPLVHLGDPVEVRVPAWPRKPFKARIGYIAPIIDAATHRLVVGAAIQNMQGQLKPNMLANVTIIAGPAATAPAVPEQAVIHEGDMTHVWVLRNDGSLVLRRIITGRSDGGTVEVIEGLSPGERIVTGGALFIDRASGNG